MSTPAIPPSASRRVMYPLAPGVSSAPSSLSALPSLHSPGISWRSKSLEERDVGAD